VRKKRNNDILPLFLANNRLVMAIRNFIFQGFMYMTWAERVYKIAFSLIFITLLSGSLNIYLALCVAHFLNYLLNGQFFVLARYLFSSSLMTRRKILKVINLCGKLKRSFGILDVLVTGSGSRNAMSSRSDLDLRVYHSSDFFSVVKALVYANILRAYGTLIGCAVDVYSFNDPLFIEKLDSDEIPISLFHCKILKSSALRDFSYEKFDPVIK